MLAQARTDDAGPAVAGPASSKLFGPHIGEVPPFIPLSASAGDPRPEGPVAMSVHHGPLRELDRAHAALGGDDLQHATRDREQAIARALGTFVRDVRNAAADNQPDTGEREEEEA